MAEASETDTYESETTDEEADDEKIDTSWIANFKKEEEFGFKEKKKVSKCGSRNKKSKFQNQKILNFFKVNKIFLYYLLRISVD